MADEVAEFHTAVADLEAAYRRGIRAFAEWYAREWKMTLETWKHDIADEPPGGPEWFEGHNAGVDSVIMGCEVFLDDYLSQ